MRARKPKSRTSWIDLTTENLKISVQQKGTINIKPKIKTTS